MIQHKSRELNERTQNSVDNHRQKNFERFMQRDDGLQRTKAERDAFLRKEMKRHTDKVKAREVILGNISVENMQKREERKLRFMDQSYNFERERKKKQETQDFWLKKEFVRNAFNAQASLTASQMVNTSKLQSNVVEN